MIAAQNICKIYYTEEIETTALKEINLTIGKGEFVSVMGPSGCGKSTLLNVLGLIDKPDSGEYIFSGIETNLLKERELSSLRKGKIGFVFQSYNLIDELTVFENIELPLVYQKVDSHERASMVNEVLNQIGMVHRRNHFPSQLSGGQQQRVAVGRAIITSPDLILADEPTGNLDSSTGDEIMNLLLNLNKKGTTILMVTHSAENAAFAQRIVNMKDGKILN